MTCRPLDCAEEYRSVDHSLLWPWFEKLYRPAMEAALPLRLHPNWMTLSGLGCAWGAFALSSRDGPISPAGAVLCAVLLHVYTVIDGFDGWQARRTGRASPFGEFLDHQCDSIVFGLIAAGLGAACGVPSLAVHVGIAAGGVAFVVAAVERVERGYLYFERISVFESTLLCSALYLVLGFSLFPAGSVARFLVSYAVVVLGCTIARTLRRLGSVPLPFWLLIGPAAAWVGLIAELPCRDWVLDVATTLFASYYTGSVLLRRGHRDLIRYALVTNATALALVIESRLGLDFLSPLAREIALLAPIAFFGLRLFFLARPR